MSLRSASNSDNENDVLEKENKEARVNDDATAAGQTVTNRKDRVKSYVAPSRARFRYKHNAIITQGKSGRVYFKRIPNVDDGERRIVFVELKIARISDIDTSNETFRCRFLMWLTWLASFSEVEEFENIKKNGAMGEEWTPTWLPKLYLVNSNDSLSDSKIVRVEDVPFSIIDGVNIENGHTKLPTDWEENGKHFGFSPRKGYYVYSMWQCDGTFCEEMELESFPLDCQDLSIKIQSTLGVKQCDLVPMPRNYKTDDIPSIEFSSKDSVVDEWQFANVLCDFRYSDKHLSRSKKIYPKVIIQVKALRSKYCLFVCLFVCLCLF